MGDGWHPNATQDLEGGIAYLRRLPREKGRKQPPEITLRSSARVADSRAEAAPLTGSPSKVINDVRTFEEMGVSYLVLTFLGNDLKESLANIKTFAQEVMPSFG